MHEVEKLCRICTFVGLALLFPLVTACDDPNRPQAVIEVRVVPDSAHLDAGETVSFEARARDRSGHELPERNREAQWSIAPPSVVQIGEADEAGRVLVTGVAPGAGDVVAAFARREGRATVYVRPHALERIEIDPSPVITSPGMRAQARARLVGLDGEEVSTTNFRISWQVAEPTVASIPLGGTGGNIPRPVISVDGQVADRQTVLRVTVNGMSTTTEVIVIREPIPPAAPVVDEEKTTPTTLVIGWDRVPQATDGYRLERGDAPDGPWTELAAPGKGKGSDAPDETSYTDEGLTPNTAYHFRLRSCNQSGCSGPSESVTASTPEAL